MTCLTVFFHSLLMTQKVMKAIAFVGTKICAAAFKKYSGGTYGRSVDTVVRGFSLFTISNSPGISRAFACELLRSIRRIVCMRRRSDSKKKNFEHAFSAVEVSHGMHVSQQCSNPRGGWPAPEVWMHCNPNVFRCKHVQSYHGVEIIATAPQSWLTLMWFSPYSYLAKWALKLFVRADSLRQCINFFEIPKPLFTRKARGINRLLRFFCTQLL